MVIKECPHCEEKLLDTFREIRLSLSGCGHAGLDHRPPGPHDGDGMQNSTGEAGGNRKKPV